MLSALLPVMPPVELIILAMAAVIASYIIFGITGFGSALIAAPVLAQAMPVAEIVPLLSLVDCTAIADQRHQARQEDRQGRDAAAGAADGDRQPARHLYPAEHAAAADDADPRRVRHRLCDLHDDLAAVAKAFQPRLGDSVRHHRRRIQRHVRRRRLSTRSISTGGCTTATRCAAR